MMVVENKLIYSNGIWEIDRAIDFELAYSLMERYRKEWMEKEAGVE